MGFYDVDVNELTVSVVARATGISEPNNMQVRTWFRDYANGFIEQIEDDDILNMASDLGWFVAIPLRLNIAEYLRIEDFFPRDRDEELLRRYRIVEMLVENGFIDPSWDDDPSSVHFRTGGDSRMMEMAREDQTPVPFGFNFLAGDQMIWLDEMPYLYLEPAPLAEVNSPTHLHHGKSFRDWLESQDGVDRMQSAILDSPYFYGGKTATHHISDNGVMEAIVVFDPLDYDLDWESMPQFQIWPTQVAPSGNLPYSYTRWGIQNGDYFTGNLICPNHEGLDTYNTILMSIPEASSHMTFLDKEGNLSVIPRWKNLLLCILNRSISTVSDRFMMSVGL